MQGLFIAGTDTGVGKTVVTAGLGAYLRDSGFNCALMKPVESGCLSGSPKSDSYFLKKLSHSPQDIDQINTYAFEEPLAPGVAAQLEGMEISFDKIGEAYKRLELLYSGILVEGAGGLMVPLTGRYMMFDLISYLELPVLLVARTGLGTINHTLLSLELLKEKGIPVAGVVLNSETKSQDPSAKYNLSTLSQWTDTPIWGVLDRVLRVMDRSELVQNIRKGIGEAVDQYFELGKVNAKYSS